MLQNAQDFVSDADRVVADDRRAGQCHCVRMGGETDGTDGADDIRCDYETGPAIEVRASIPSIKLQIRTQFCLFALVFKFSGGM